MSDLLAQISSAMMQSVMNINFNIQLFNEALHAFNDDDWYKLNKHNTP